ncbi:MAG: toll/interleukin-1 receptor domain-containing protein [Thiobacillus sp.]|nr:toll/interleukin-1 receptor domain-containing protein [Thiobacillus sp.]
MTQDASVKLHQIVLGLKDPIFAAAATRSNCHHNIGITLNEVREAYLASLPEDERDSASRIMPPVKFELPESTRQDLLTLGSAEAVRLYSQLQTFLESSAPRGAPVSPQLNSSGENQRVKIFISHASVDEPLASALVDCIFSSMVLDDSDVRCTSVPGHKLEIGSEFVHAIRTELDESAVVVGVITENAIRSGWVLFELGAAWGAEKKLKPLVSDEVKVAALPGPLSGRHAARLSDESDVLQFLDELATFIAARPRASSKRSKAIDALLAAHTEHLKTCVGKTGAGKSTEHQGRPPSPTDVNRVTQADVTVFEQLLELLKPTGVISFLREHDFGGSFFREDIAPLHTFVAIGGNPDNEFVDSTLEKERQLLLKNASDLAMLIAKYTSPNEFGRFSVLPSHLADSPRPDWVLREAKELNEAASAFVEIYDNFIRFCRARIANRSF